MYLHIITSTRKWQLQLEELLSYGFAPPERKLKLLKEIAIENEVDWDPAALETEFFTIEEYLHVSSRW